MPLIRHMATTQQLLRRYADATSHTGQRPSRAAARPARPRRNRTGG